MVAESKSGCAWCCHQRIAASALEVFTAARLIQGFQPDFRDLIIGNVVLVDELNRTTPKTQSGLREAMGCGERVKLRGTIMRVRGRGRRLTHAELL